MRTWKFHIIAELNWREKAKVSVDEMKKLLIEQNIKFIMLK